MEENTKQNSPVQKPTDDHVPEKIGPYKIVSLLNKGGMSYLYLATDSKTQEPIIIKVLSPQFLSRPDVVERFLNEANIIAMTDHPNIVKLLGHDRWEEGLYIAMEFVHGISLRQYLQRHPLSLKRALEIILQIAYALCHLHTHGVIHRDLKLENVLVTDTGNIKVIDFGIAQLLTENVEQKSSSYQLIGTPFYMSPEQRENPLSVSYPSDIYSLGIIAYELVLGKLSHGRIHLSLVPKGLQKILAKSLQPRPEDRYHDIVDFITDISAYLNSSTMENEKKEGDYFSEIVESLEKTHISFTTTKMPRVDLVEIGFSYQHSLLLPDLYFDCFELSNKQYIFLLAKPVARAIEGMLHLSLLRGMLCSLCSRATDALELLSQVNSCLLHDKTSPQYSVQSLTLDPTKNTFRYLSCGPHALWTMEKGKINPIFSDQPFLGSTPTGMLKEEVRDWKKEERLILSSFHVQKEGLTEAIWTKALLEQNSLPPQQQSESIFRKLRLYLPKLLEEESHVLFSIELQK